MHIRYRLRRCCGVSPHTSLSHSLGARVAWLRVASQSHFGFLGCSCFSVRVGKEPAWHRLLRRKRQRARTVVRLGAHTTLGKRRRRSIRVALAWLQSHHSWDHSAVPWPIRKKIAMTWYCQVCQVQNGQKYDTCRGCKAHWSQVWSAPVKRRSRSKSAKAKKKETAKSQDAEQWQVFPDRVPWIPSTPATRTALKASDTPLGGKQKELGSSQAITLPSAPTKEEVLTEDDKKKLTHLRALKSMEVDFPEMLESQLVMLEEKERISLNSKALTHGHLNKLTKLKAQIAAQSKKITTLDQEWGAFVQHTMENIKHHSEMYQQCRGELLELYNLRLEEMRQMKQELTMASRSLLDNQLEEPEVQETINVEDQMTALKETMAALGTVTSVVDLMEDDEILEVPASQEDDVATGNKDAKMLVKPAFRGAASPQKVAQLHLKAKKDKDKTEK